MLLLFLLSPLCLGVGGCGPGFLIQLACCCFFLTTKRKIESMVYFIYLLAFIGVCICMFVEIKKY